MEKQRYYLDMEYYNFGHGVPGLNDTNIQIDSINCNTVTIVNTSIAGIVHVEPGLDLQVGQSVTFRGCEQENNKTKVIIKMDHFFFGNIEYSFCVIKKKYYYDANTPKL